MIQVVKDLDGKESHVIIDDDLAFLAPYLKVAKALGVPVWKLKAIRGYTVPPEKLERQKAQITRRRKYTISILKAHQELSNDGGVFGVRGYMSADVGFRYEETLDSLAHELSHLLEWDHTADRYLLEKRISVAFAKLAKKMGYCGYAN